ncbi:hypothetical protein DRO97_03160, partial [Archaeoglobales archaeon]
MRETLRMRKRQILAAIYWRREHFKECKVYDILGDLGIAHATLFDHLEDLKTLNLISFDKSKARNLNHSDYLNLTIKGENIVNKLFDKYNIKITMSLSEILKRVAQKPVQKKFKEDLSDFGLERIPIPTLSGYSGKLSEVMRKIVEKNLTEPVSTSLAMYSDIDQLLYDLKKNNNELFKTISRGWLNLEIRQGRIASISIPVAIRNNMYVSRLRKLLQTTWAWPEIASSRSWKRYEIEASSMGLIDIQKDLVSSTKPTTSYLLEWLAKKTYNIFENIPSPNPKAALIVYKEAFNFPTEDEILAPENSSIRLDWLDLTRDRLGRTDYEQIITKTLNILKEKIGAIISFGDRLIPYGYSRIIKEVPDVKNRLKTLLNLAKEGDLTSNILLLVHAHPSITAKELKDKLDKEGCIVDIQQVEEVLNYLQKMGLVIIGVLPGNVACYYTFLHVPYIIPKRSSNDNSVKDANAVVRNYIVYVLSTVKKSFKDAEQLNNLHSVIEDLTKGKEISADDLSSRYEHKFTYSFIKFALQLEPIIMVDENNWIFKLKDERIGNLVLDIVAYELLTGSEALSEYSDLLTGIISRNFDKKTIVRSSQNLKESLL